MCLYLLYISCDTAASPETLDVSGLTFLWDLMFLLEYALSIRKLGVCVLPASALSFKETGSGYRTNATGTACWKYSSQEECAIPF